MNLFCIGLSHHTADVATREQFAGNATAESIARDAGCATLGLNVFADNPGAMALYHILGFQTVSRHLNKVIRDGG